MKNFDFYEFTSILVLEGTRNTHCGGYLRKDQNQLLNF